MKLRDLTAAFVLIATAACASGSGGGQTTGTGTQRQLDIRINNNLIPPRTLTIYLVPRSGIEQNLGDLIGSGVRTLSYRGLALQGEYQLVARVVGAERAVFSNIIVMDKVRLIDWDLQRNFVEIRAVDE
jgi:hypothetical protein